jgi:hypothetical protein
MIASWQETFVFTHISRVGVGSADTDVTAVAAKPCGVPCSAVVITETPATSLRMPRLKSAE